MLQPFLYRLQVLSTADGYPSVAFVAKDTLRVLLYGGCESEDDK